MPRTAADYKLLGDQIHDMVAGFKSEWVSVYAVRGHTVLLECRLPGMDKHLCAELEMELVDPDSIGDAKVGNIYYDDKACVYRVLVASTNAKDGKLDGALPAAPHGILVGRGNPVR